MGAANPVIHDIDDRLCPPTLECERSRACSSTMHSADAVVPSVHAK